MKKLLAIILAVVMVMALVACGNTNDAPTTTAATNSGNETTEGTEGTAGNTAALSTVESGKLIMATNAEFPPYEYIEDNKIVGIDAEIAKAIADKLGLELVIDDMEFDSIVESVKGGKADIGLAGMTVTPDREEEVSFTASYATGV